VLNHVDDAQLHGGLREHGFDGIRESLQTVNASDEDILHATIAKLSDDLQPEFGTFRLCQPRPQNFLLAVHSDTDGQIDGLYLVDNGISDRRNQTG